LSLWFAFVVDTASSLVRSARPFSLVVALTSCGLGLWLGVGERATSLGIILAVLCAGLLLQLGVNLINDKTDLHLLRDRDPATARHRAAIRLSYRIGLVCLALAIGIGLWLVALRGWGLLVIGIVGVVGAFAYTTEPLNYKRRGLGVPLVFWLMGVLMVLGSYMALTGEPSWRVFWHSLPLSFLISALLLANEIRDVERDRVHGIHTLSVRIGLNSARRLYWALIACAYGFSTLYAGLAWLSGPFWLLIPLPLLVPLTRHLNAPTRIPLPPWTGRFLLLFAVVYALAI